jgi:hypothetical protein
LANRIPERVENWAKIAKPNLCDGVLGYAYELGEAFGIGVMLVVWIERCIAGIV